MKKHILVLLFVFLGCMNAFSVDNAFGVNSHAFPAHSYVDTSMGEVRMSEMGVGWIRAEMPWFCIETAPGVFNFSNSDKIIKFAQKYDINVLFVLAYTPEFYGGTTQHNMLSPNCIDNWKMFVEKTVERYDGDGIDDMPGLIKPVKHWNIWNEPNLSKYWNTNPTSSRKQFFVQHILSPAVESIRRTDPEAKICGPELSSSGDPEGWLFYITGQLGHVFDILTHHQYNGGDTPSGRYNALTSFYYYAVCNLGYYGRKLWVTETGYGRSKFSETVISDYLRQTMDYMNSSRWWEKTFWYCWSADTNYQLVDELFNPTLVYDAYKSYILSN